MPTCLSLDRTSSTSSELLSRCQIVALSAVALAGLAVVVTGCLGLLSSLSDMEFAAAMGASAILSFSSIVVLASHAIASCLRSREEGWATADQEGAEAEEATPGQAERQEALKDSPSDRATKSPHADAQGASIHREKNGPTQLPKQLPKMEQRRQLQRPGQRQTNLRLRSPLKVDDEKNGLTLLPKELPKMEQRRQHQPTGQRQINLTTGDPLKVDDEKNGLTLLPKQLPKMEKRRQHQPTAPRQIHLASRADKKSGLLRLSKHTLPAEKRVKLLPMTRLNP